MRERYAQYNCLDTTLLEKMSIRKRYNCIEHAFNIEVSNF